jgi:hypothetical protein
MWLAVVFAGSDVLSGQRIIDGGAGSGRPILYVADGRVQVKADGTAIGTSPANSVKPANVFIAQFDVNQTLSSLNGTTFATDAATYSVMPTFGLSGDTGFFEAFLGTVGAAHWGLGTLSTDDRQMLEGYLADSFGTQGDLPADHPYKTAPPTVAGGPTLTANNGSLVLSGRTANLLLGHTLPAAPGLIGLDGRPLQARAARRIASEVGAIALAGQEAALRQARMLFAASGSINLSGRAVSLLHGYSLAAGAGGLAIAGGAAQLRRSSQLTAAGGSIQLTGWSASLDRVGRYGLDAAGIAFNVVGAPAVLRLRRRLSASAGLLTVTGGAAVLVKPGRYAINAASGSFAVNGGAAGGRAARHMVADARQLAWSGAPAVLRVARRVAPATGVYALNLRSASLTIGGALPPIEIPVANRFIVPARQRAFVITARPRAFIIRKGARMSPIRKHRTEERRYSADWTFDLAGQSITGDIVASSNDPALIVDRVTYAGAIMWFWLRGGTPGEVSTILFTAPTSGQEHLSWAQTVSIPSV